MNKKRFIALVLLLLMCVGMFGDVAQAAKKKAFTGSKAAFKVGATSYKIGTSSTTWKRKLGSYERSEVEGYDEELQSYVYTFKRGVKITTEVKEKKETMISVTITGKQIGTSAGLKVGQTIDRMETLYGTKYRKSGTTYSYTAGKATLGVKVSGKKIKTIFITLDSD